MKKRTLLCAALTAALLCGGAQAAADDISYVLERGLFRGATTESFEENEPMTRGMAVAVLARLAKAPGVKGTDFTDVSPDAYYADAAAWAAKNGLSQGDGAGRFEPDRPVEAEELGALLSRYWAWLGRTDAPPQPAGEGPLSRGAAAEVFAAADRALSARDTRVLTHTAKDGTALAGKLDLPAEGAVDRIVVFVNGSGPNTYDNRRQFGTVEFNYFDLFAEQLAARGVGFFRMDTRGVSAGEEPPLYSEIDGEAYRTYVPETSVSDLGEWVGVLRQDERLADAKVYLLGWSEGTIIAPLAAKAFPDEVDGLLLAGYCNDTMNDILEWQQTGGSSMVFYRGYFDADGDGAVSRAEFEADPYGLRASMLGGVEFDGIDVDGDGALTQADFAAMLAPSRKALSDAIARGDDAWLAENYGVRLTSAWFEAHKKLAPNSETLPQLTLPIEIFHGTLDQNCNVEGVRAIAQSFADAGKTNLKTHIYEDYDHDLNYMLYPATGRMSQAIEDMFNACRTMA